MVWVRRFELPHEPASRLRAPPSNMPSACSMPYGTGLAFLNPGFKRQTIPSRQNIIKNPRINLRFSIMVWVRRFELPAS
jgi:hypothetical protein